MTLFRYYAKKIFGPYLGHVPPEKAAKYMAISRMIYFFSATSLLLLFNKFRQDFEKEALESGKPIIKDHSNNHKAMRERGAEIGIIYEYSPGKGLTSTDYNRNEYYQQLEREAYEMTKQAQERAIAEGRELPADAIKLV